MIVIGDADVAQTGVRLAWLDLLTVLSLHRARPFTRLVGLEAEVAGQHEAALQEVVRDIQAWMRQDDDAGPAEVIRFFRDHLNALFQEISATDAEGALALRAALDLAARFDRPETWRQAWRPLFVYRLARFWSPAAMAGEYKIAPEHLETLFSVVTSLADQGAQLGAALKQADAQPLEGWDAQVYAAYRAEDPEASPLIGFGLLLDQVLFERSWRQVVAAFSPPEIDELERWGLTELVVHMRSLPAGWATLPESARRPPDGGGAGAAS